MRLPAIVKKTQHLLGGGSLVSTASPKIPFSLDGKSRTFDFPCERSVVSQRLLCAAFLKWLVCHDWGPMKRRRGENKVSLYQTGCGSQRLKQTRRMEVKDKRAAEWSDRCLKDELKTAGRLTGWREMLLTIFSSQI